MSFVSCGVGFVGCASCLSYFPDYAIYAMTMSHIHIDNVIILGYNGLIATDAYSVISILLNRKRYYIKLCRILRVIH